MAISQPLRARRLTLEPFDDRFLTERYIGWLNDPAVVRFSEQRHRVHTRESCRVYVEAQSAGVGYLWAIVVDAAVEPLGHIGNLSATVNEPNRVADLAILIGERQAWGKGYASEAWLRACRFLFGVGIRKITAGTMACNTAMLGLMARTGMAVEGRRRRQFLLDGEEQDLALAALYPETLAPEQAEPIRS